MSTLIAIIITYYLFLLIIIIIIITKSHNNYCSVGVVELCLLNLLVMIDFFCVILTLVCSLRACHMWLARNHMFIREIWGEFTSFIFWNFEVSLVWFERFQNFKKMNSVNLSQISLLNMWLLYQFKFVFHNCEKYNVLWAGKICWTLCFYLYSLSIKLRKDKFSWHHLKKISRNLQNEGMYRT